MRFPSAPAVGTASAGIVETPCRGTRSGRSPPPISTFARRHAFMVASHPSRSIDGSVSRSEEHTSELQSLAYLVCRLLLEKKKKKNKQHQQHSSKNRE